MQFYQCFNIEKLMRAKAMISREPDGIKPKLGLVAGGLNVNVRRFLPVVAEEDIDIVQREELSA